MSVSAARCVARAMERIAPLSLAEKWDNVGLLLEAPHPPNGPHKVLLTVDLTTRVAAEALALPASVIVSYHPPIFRPLSSITLSSPIQASLLRCAAAGISVFSPHTSLDCVHGGINDWLASGLGPSSITFVGKEKENGSGGVGRVANLEHPVSLTTIVERVKAHLGLQHVQVATSPYASSSNVRSVAICAGSGGSMLAGSTADVYWTGEMQHHEVLAAVAAGRHVILCGHTNTERGYLPMLAERLQVELARAEGSDAIVAAQMSIHLSSEDRHPLEIV
ncbi:NIF3-like protein-like protein [Vararia minispora EC-137]|uniref:NIF3-like protein-like protein n=1 Tax=Vararia minispora EC-137 TaxID=1314806 RepID=A0ACB8QHB7_9AGAM|nr:NIF3-like protein-like protein [Vararia minispora EC-137]